jgi:PAS domain S-box-containing protein
MCRKVRLNKTPLWDINQEAIRFKSEHARQLGLKSFEIIGITSSVLLLFAFTFLFNLPNYISQPIERLKNGIRQILQRDYTARVEISSSDELGELGEAFNEMARKLDFWEHSNWAQVLFEKKRIETIIEQMEDAIIGLDEHQQVLFVNPVMGKLTGLQPRDIIGENALTLALHNDLLRHLLRQEHQSKGDLKIYFEGQERFFKEEKHAVYNGTTLIGQVLLLKDITQFKELDLAKTNFIATISHELKTPIAAIKMSVKLLSDTRIGALNVEQQKLTSQISDDSDRLLKITGELLDLSQVETGNIRLELSPTRVDYLVGYATRAVETFLLDRQIKLDIQLSHDLPVLMIDPDKTAWVLVNLLSNAIKYSPEGASIQVRATREQQSLCLSIRDFGKGIDPRYLPQVFVKFFQAPGSGMKDIAGGSGLGLAISKEFIEAQGGTIKVESVPNEGATFSVYLPLPA